MVTRNPSMRRRNKNTPPKRIFEGVVDTIGARGDGVVTVGGEQIFVPYTAPADHIKLETKGQNGQLLEVLSAGPDRTDPPCEYFGRCGGCALQHVTRDFYVKWKTAQIESALAAAGIIDAPIANMVEIPPATRHRAQFAVQRSGSDVQLGYFEKRSRNLVPIDNCLVLHPKLQEKLGALRTLAGVAPKSWAGFSMAVTLYSNGLDVNFVSAKRLDDPTPDTMQKLAKVIQDVGVIRVSANGEILMAMDQPAISFDGIFVSPPPGAFLQASEMGQAALIGLVLAAAKDAKKIIDLFAGCGTFSLPLSKTATVEAVDSDAAAIGALKNAAAIAQGQKTNPIKTGIRNLFDRPFSALELKKFDVIVIDPPRAGAIAQMREIAASKIRRVISVSCDLKTFARDAKILIEGGYTLTQLTPVDQFAYSPHIELVGVFERLK